MNRALRPLTVLVVALSFYLVAVWCAPKGFPRAAFTIVGHGLMLLAIVRFFYVRRHPIPQVKPSPVFTRTPGWRAFKLFYCLAVPVLTYWAVSSFQDAQYNPFMHIDASRGDVNLQHKQAEETFRQMYEENAPVVQSMWIGLPLLAIGLFYAIRQSIAYIIGRPNHA